MPIVRRRLTDKGVAALGPKGRRYSVPDPECIGLYVRVTPSGAKSFCAVARDPFGKQIWTTIGSADHLGVEDARAKAREIIKRVKAGLPAIEPPPPVPECFQSVAENWLQRHVRAKRLRSAGEIERALRKYVFPLWSDRDFRSIRRADLAMLLDHVEDQRGARIADLVLAYVRSIGNWYAARSDDYVSPVVRGMRRHGPHKRDRILSDEELRVVWRAAEKAGTFGAIVRLALLTAQRRDKLATMRWADISADDVWTVPSEERQKGVGGALPLPTMAIDIIGAQPHVEGNPYVFPGRGAGHFNGFSPCKRAFDRNLSLPQWGLHDLRRTARSLMSRAGISSDHAERVLGHVISGVEGVYDRHRYEAEKGQALAALADLIKSVLDPPSDRVVPFRGRP